MNGLNGHADPTSGIAAPIAEHRALCEDLAYDFGMAMAPSRWGVGWGCMRSFGDRSVILIYLVTRLCL